MFFMLLLAALSRCASLLLCPTDTELIDALLADDTAIKRAVADEALRKGEVVLFHLPQGVWRIQDVSCGEREPSNLPTITCKSTARYAARDVPQIARLRKQNGNWRIVEAHLVEPSYRWSHDYLSSDFGRSPPSHWYQTSKNQV